MATKSNPNRKRLIRSAIASLSILSLLPLVGAMQSGQASYTTDAGSVAAAPAEALMSTAATAAETTPATVATSVATTTTAAATSSQSASSTTTKAAAPVSYTRTQAS